MFINTKHRTTQIEIMDDFNMEGSVLRDALDKIAKINQPPFFIVKIIVNFSVNSSVGGT